MPESIAAALQAPSPLASISGCQNLLNDLLEADPAEIGKSDVGLLNLLCAPALPGSEGLDIPRCLARLDNLAGFVKASAERNLYRFPSDPDFGQCEPKWRIAMLVTNLRLDYGATYDPDVKDDLKRHGDSPFVDSRNVFIHGLLSDDPKRRWGSCSSIPVLITAVARRLGYPVRLAVNRKHVYARWDDGQGLAFNIEASTDNGGFAIPDDDHYRNDFGPPPTAKEIASDMHFRSLTPAEEFALFLKARAQHLHDVGRHGETLLWSARALQFAPAWPYFSGKAYEWVELGIKHRYRQKYPDRPIPPPERNEEFFCNPGEFLRIEERSLFLTITAHYLEYLGELDKARRYYEEAARQNFHGRHEQRDLQRFIQKHGAKRRIGPLLPPQNIGQPRRIKLPNCPPEHEADTLRHLADRFQREGKLLMARDCLHDLYLFDPCDAAVFQRARYLEDEPQFQAQLKAIIEQRRKELQQSGQLTKSNP